MEQGTGGDGLDGLAQTHLIGQQRAFREGEVQHALTLVRKEGDFGFVRGPFAALHFQFVVAPELFAFHGMAPAIEPGREFLRQTQCGHRAGDKLLQRLNGFFGRTFVESAVWMEPGSQGGGEAVIGVGQPDRVAGGIGQQIEARRPVGFRSPEQPFEARLKLQQQGLNLFEGAEAIDAEINAIAGELPPAHIADFDGVGQAAARPDAEVGEDRMSRVGVRDAEFLRSGALAAAVDFVLVRRAPIVRRRHGNFRRCLFWHGRDDRDSMGGVKADLSEVIHRLFTVGAPSPMRDYPKWQDLFILRVMRRLKINLIELEGAFETNFPEMHDYLDTETGEVLSVTDDIRQELEQLWEEAGPKDKLEGLLRKSKLPDLHKKALAEAQRVEDDYGTRIVRVPEPLRLGQGLL